MSIIRQIITSVCFLALAAAVWAQTAVNSSGGGSSEKSLFQAGEQQLIEGKYPQAIKNFEQLDSQYPFSPYARQTILNLIYAYYRNGDHISSAATAGRYIHLYPRGPYVDYAYYMKGLANFERKTTLLGRLFYMDPALRDLGTAIESYDDFMVFIRRFPHSPYVADARQRMIYLRNLFAAKEMLMGLYYYRHDAYVAAANRATFIVHNYPQAPVAEDALILLVKANHALGLKQEAEEAKKVLFYNFPDANLAVDLR